MKNKKLLSRQDVNQRIARLIMSLCDECQKSKSPTIAATIVELKKSIG
ncbi:MULTISPECIES: hypothetical protein [Convivina]|nr:MULTISPECIES: hypothetical protein [Convivina]CAH1855685.1 hypothetical protein R077811_01094 [Convivina intestini]CAH1855769.1 hypothetical protein R078138_01207 [Convivina sp. LMG 32447]